MPKESAELPKGVRITDHISLGVLTKTFSRKLIDQILKETGRKSIRQRDLPAHVMIYYVIALSIYMYVSCKEVLRCLREGLVWLFGPERAGKTTGKSGISQARKRLGVEPMRRLYIKGVSLIATKRTRGARYKKWKLVSLDGSTLDLADTQVNDNYFGRPKGGRGKGAFPQLRFVSLVENGTHVLFGAEPGKYNDSEMKLADKVKNRLTKGMLCLADRYFFGYNLWKKSANTGADLLWRIKKNLILPCHKRLEDGSYISKIYESAKNRRQDKNGIMVRVIEYTLDGLDDAEPIYRLITTVLNPKVAPSADLAALYQERWEIETAFDELKTHLRGARIVLRSKTPDGVHQEFYGLMLAHFAVRNLMHEAALKTNIDPDRLSFVHSVCVVRRKLPFFVATPP